jgi:hypothetical protein
LAKCNSISFLCNDLRRRNFRQRQVSVPAQTAAPKQGQNGWATPNSVEGCGGDAEGMGESGNSNRQKCWAGKCAFGGTESGAAFPAEPGHWIMVLEPVHLSLSATVSRNGAMDPFTPKQSL